MREYIRNPAELIGHRCIFRYPVEFTSLDDYSEHRDHTCTVVRECTPDEADLIWDDPDCTGTNHIVDKMYVVHCEDGWIGHAWDSELEIITERSV